MKKNRASSHRVLPICNLGAPGHGKTTLTAAIAKVVARIGAIQTEIDGSFATQPPVHQPIREGVGITYRAIDYETSGKFYKQIDCEKPLDVVKMLISGSPRIQGAIWVVNAVDGVTPDSAAHLRLASDICLPTVIPFLNIGGIPQEDELLNICELEMCELLNESGWIEYAAGTEKTAAVIIGDAQSALTYKGDKLNSVQWKPIVDLVFALNRWMPEPVNVTQLPLIMPIYGIIEETRDSVTVHGEIVQGHLAVGQAVDIVGKGDRIKTRCLGITDNEVHVEAEPGWLSVGQVLCTPKTVKSHAAFSAIIYLLTQEESGTHIPLIDKDRPDIHLWGVDMPTHLQLPADLSIMTPGTYASVTMRLDLPLVIEVGTRFEVKKMGARVGIGIVTGLD